MVLGGTICARWSNMWLVFLFLFLFLVLVLVFLFLFTTGGGDAIMGLECDGWLLFLWLF